MFDSEEFLKLKAKWYKKLKQSGFKDIEKSETELIKPSKVLPLTVEETMKYYMKLQSYLNNAEFDSWEHRIIFYMHSEGATIKEISEVLNKSSSTVSRLIKKYEKQVFK